jgi:plasmid stability protein
MSVNLSIKNVSDALAERLRARASRNHRSIQGELMAILEAALAPGDRLGPREILARVRELGLGTGDEASDWIRAERDAR